MNATKYTLIFLRDDTFLLSSALFSDWREIQACFPEYMTSLTFGSLDEIREFLQIEYGLSQTIAEQAVPDTIFATQPTAKLRWEEQ